MRLIILLMFLSNPLLAQKVEEGFFVWDEEKIHLDLLNDIKTLTIDHLSKKGYEVYGPLGTGAYLSMLGLTFTHLLDGVYARTEGYLSSTEINRQLQEMHRKYPQITKLTEIGKSVNGVPLLVLKVSDNPLEDETEPEFKYIGCMHGNEITGRETMLWFAWELLKSYEIGDEQVLKLVNNTEIFILPSMNPDGNDARTRSNANGYDLNRNFPDFTTSDSDNDLFGRQPETQALMKWQAKRKFALSANFHSGAEVVNYPWDTTLERHPLDALIKEFSLEYSKATHYMFSSSEFDQGITNGADWYEVNGGMQDWSYFYHGDLQVTVELSDIKWPYFSETQNYFSQNIPALLGYAKRVHQGLGFYHNKSNVNGEVKIFKQVQGQWKLFETSYFDQSEFYRVLPTGKYRFEVIYGPDKRILFGEVRDNVIAPNYLVIE